MATLPVFRDAESDLLLVRCTECGKLHPANQHTTVGRVWLQRLGVSMLAVWMFFLLWMLFMGGLAEMGMHMVTIDSFTTYNSARGGGVVEYPEREELFVFIFMVSMVSFVVPFIEVSILAAAAHHWRRWAYYVPAVLLPLIPFAIAWQNWNFQMPELADWTFGVMTSIYAVQLAGGLTAAALCRRQTRLLASILLPPRMRASMGFLWIADGLKPPACSKPSETRG